MKDFDIAKYLREHQLGSYGILNHYVDLKPLKEEETEEELATEVPYAGPDQKLTGNGEGDEFEQAQTVSEMQDSESEFYDRIWGLAGDQIKSVIDSLRSDGFEDEDIKNAFMTAVDQYDQVFPPMEEEWYPNDDAALEKGRKKIVKEE